MQGPNDAGLVVHEGQTPLPPNVTQQWLDAEHFLIQLEQRMVDGDNFDDIHEKLIDNGIRELAQRIIHDLKVMYEIVAKT